MSFLLEAVGPGTERLAQLRPSEGLNLVGPLGIGWRLPRDGSRPLLVGGGIGTAPLLCLQDDLGPDVQVLLGFSSADHATAPIHPGVMTFTDTPRRRRSSRGGRRWPPTTALPAARHS